MQDGLIKGLIWLFIAFLVSLMGQFIYWDEFIDKSAVSLVVKVVWVAMLLLSSFFVMTAVQCELNERITFRELTSSAGLLALVVTGFIFDGIPVLVSYKTIAPIIIACVLTLVSELILLEVCKFTLGFAGKPVIFRIVWVVALLLVVGIFWLTIEMANK